MSEIAPLQISTIPRTARVAVANQCNRENRAPHETDCGTIGSAELFGPWRRPMSTSVFWTETTIELPEVIEDGMSGRNEQRNPGTARGSPRRSRTAKASRISRLAVKARCAHEGDGWGRISDDGSGHYNPNPSEDPWGGGVISLHGGAQSSLWPDTVRDNHVDSEVHKGRMQTGRRTAHAGSRLKLPTIQERHRLDSQPSSRTGENPPYVAPG